MIIRPASSQAQDRKSSPVKDQRSTTVLYAASYAPDKHADRRTNKQTDGLEYHIRVTYKCSFSNYCSHVLFVASKILTVGRVNNNYSHGRVLTM